ncbi:hypothetical protein ACFLUP_04245 [Chloroflexota bacterium]
MSKVMKKGIVTVAEMTVAVEDALLFFEEYKEKIRLIFHNSRLIIA